ncbi:MAG: hypothetical protein QXO57_03855 [Candidatus Aenigmatarchaeota archaeon]
MNLKNVIKYEPYLRISEEEEYIKVIERITTTIARQILGNKRITQKRQELILAIQTWVEHLILCSYYNKLLVVKKSRKYYDSKRDEGLTELSYYQVFRIYKSLLRLKYIEEVYKPVANPQNKHFKKKKTYEENEMATRSKPTKKFMALVYKAENDLGIALTSKIVDRNIAGHKIKIYNLRLREKTAIKKRALVMVNIDKNKANLKFVKRNERYRHNYLVNNKKITVFEQGIGKEEEFEVMKSKVESYNRFMERYEVLQIDNIEDLESQEILSEEDADNFIQAFKVKLTKAYLQTKEGGLR